MARSGVSVETQLAESLPAVRGDRVQLEQVTLNLMINAIEAMSETSEGPRELVTQCREGRRWRARHGAGFRSRVTTRERREAVRGLLHDQIRRLADGIVDLSFDHRIASGTTVGDRQCASRCRISICVAP
jgi:signal transduction histidine kinase